MGLDMYLFKKKKEEDFEKREQVAYWRQANQVRQWLVTNTGYKAESNREYHKLTKQQLEKLVADCQAVLDNNTLAEKLMPAKGGQKIDFTSLFQSLEGAVPLTPPVVDTFGSTAYDGRYFAELLNTVAMLKAALNATDFGKEEIDYYECW